MIAPRNDGPLRILFVIDHFGSGGAQRQMVTLACGLHDRGHQVEFFIYYPEHRFLASQLEQRGIRIHEHPKEHRFSLGVPFALRRLVASTPYDAVLSFLDTPNVYAELAALGRASPPVIVSERSAFDPAALPPGKRLKQHLHRLADRIVVNSHHQRQSMETTFPWMKPKILTITNGVDLQRFSPPPAGEARHRDRPLQLLAVGTIYPVKNAEGLARALLAYRDRYGRPPQLRWVGKIGLMERDRRVFDDVSALLREAGLRDAWEWLGERADVPDLLRSHDALIHPSFFEGLPNAACEALACGRPVLLSDVCDHRWLTQGGKTGLLFDPRRPGDIADAIHRFVEMTPGERAAMGQQARQFAERAFSIAAYVSNYEALFRAVGRYATALDERGSRS